MNTNKFQAGDRVIIRGVVVKNDGSDVIPYNVKIGEDTHWCEEEELELDTRQQPTEQQYNRGQMAATILAGLNSNHFSNEEHQVEHAVHITDLLISELNKNKQ